MVMRRSDVNSWVQTYGGAQLRTFDVTATYRITTYTRSVRLFGNSSSGGTSSVVTVDRYARFEYTGASNALYNNYVDSGINTGNIIYPQDIVDTMEDLVRRTVDLIEPRITNRTVNARVCHGSCHNNCHSSRGRR
jgi:hypothetical protein